MIKIDTWNSTAPDFESVHRFLEKHRHQNNAVRDDGTLLERVTHKKFVLLSDSSRTEESLIGVSGIFEHGTEAQWREAGATRIILNGFRLQQLATSIRALHEFILDPGFDAFFATVVDGNQRSAENLMSCGFVPWDAPAALIEIKHTLHADSGMPSRQLDYFKMPIEALPKLADQILRYDQPGYVLRRPSRTPGDVTDALLSMRVDILTEYRPVLEQIASGDLDIY